MWLNITLLGERSEKRASRFFHLQLSRLTIYARTHLPRKKKQKKIKHVHKNREGGGFATDASQMFSVALTVANAAE